MNFFKKIFTNGVFNTMIDENVSPRGRKIAWLVVTVLYLLLITAITLLIFVYEIPVWRGIMIAFLVIAILSLLWLYIRLWNHLRKRKRNKKKEAIERELRIKAQIRAVSKNLIQTPSLYKNRKNRCTGIYFFVLQMSVLVV